jgi:hypothetical protein
MNHYFSQFPAGLFTQNLIGNELLCLVTYCSHIHQSKSYHTQTFGNTNSVNMLFLVHQSEYSSSIHIINFGQKNAHRILTNTIKYARVIAPSTR